MPQQRSGLRGFLDTKAAAKRLRDSEIVVHVGAARTGTSALQAALRADDATLRAAGTVCLTPEGFGYRKPDTLRAVTRAAEAMAGTTGLSAHLAAYRARRLLASLIGPGGYRRLILSDENLIGPILDTQSGEALYPRARSVLQALSRILTRDPDRVVLVIRPYEDFIPSAFSMLAAYAHSRFDHTRFPAGLADPAHGWPELAEAISRACPDAKLDILRTDQSKTGDVRQTLLEVSDSAALAPIARVNASPSQTALQAIAARPPGDKTGIDALIARHADDPALRPLSDDQAARLRDRYVSDCERLGLGSGNG